MLVERDGLVDQLRSVRGRFVAVLGEAGAGKTVLVAGEEYLIGQDEAALDAARHAVSVSGADPRGRAVAIGWLSRVSQPESRQLRLAAEAVELLEPRGRRWSWPPRWPGSR